MDCIKIVNLKPIRENLEVLVIYSFGKKNHIKHSIEDPKFSKIYHIYL